MANHGNFPQSSVIAVPAFCNQGAGKKTVSLWHRERSLGRSLSLGRDLLGPGKSPARGAPDKVTSSSPICFTESFNLFPFTAAIL